MLSRRFETTAVMVILMSIRTYSELSKLQTFEERFDYLKLNGVVGYETFGFDRYLNQIFYTSKRWRKVRDKVIIRDNACDLGVDGRDILGRIYIHHMNILTLDDIVNETEFLIEPEFLICTTHNTHNAIHYGDKNLLILDPIERSKNDTCPWRRT